MKNTAYQLVLTTYPELAVAERLAHVLVTERLAACVNLLPAMRSVYRWQAKVESTEEYLLIIKGKISDYAAIERRITELHPYELPEVIAVPIVGGHSAYLAWLGDPDRTR